MVLGQREREAILARLAASPPANEPWTLDAARALVALREVEAVEVRLSSPECRAEGCFVEARFRTMADFARGRERFTRQVVERYPQGSKIVTAPELQPSGEILNYWILQRPNQGQANNLPSTRRIP